MDTLTFIVELVKALAWPAAIVSSAAMVVKAYRDQPNEDE